MGRTKTLARLISLGTAIPFLALLLPACSGKRSIVVASKNFTEQVVLGEIAAQQMERRLGVTVTRKLNLGGTLLAHEALVAGQVDLYPEYTGTALTAVLKLPPDNDARRVFDTVAAHYRKRWKLHWLPPLGFDNTFAMVIRGEAARVAGITTLSQAALRTDGWLLGVGYEFEGRPDGLPGLRKTYGLSLKGTPKTMDLGLLYTALLDGQVEMVAANATDGLLAARDLKVLEDDRHYFPPYQAAFVVGDALLRREPRARKALEELSGALTNETIRKLNFKVDGEHRSVADVAREFLKGKEPAKP